MDSPRRRSRKEREPKDYHQRHCESCVNLKKCAGQGKVASENPSESCPIISCRSCSFQFHQCKQSEHDLLCPRVKEPCINSSYGCPALIERRWRGSHLTKCPASVVVCSMEWNRWPVRSGGDSPQPFPLDPSHLDVAALQRDELTVQEWKRLIPFKLRQTLKNRVTSKHAVMPLGVSGHRIPNCILDEALQEPYKGSPSSEEPSSSSDTPWGLRKAPPGLQESVCNKLASTLRITNDAGSSLGPLEDSGVSLGEAEVVEERGDQHVELNINVETITRYLNKPEAIYTFMCGREFRRDELPNHFRAVHSSIMSQLNGGSLFSRCPLASQGCPFGLERLYPHAQGYRIIYNGDLDSWCSTQKESPENIGEGPRNPEEDENGPDFEICSLPFELLILLTKYLDPLSLNALSLTCTRLRSVCEATILQRGIVVHQWEKIRVSGEGAEEKMGWRVVSNKWIFSTSFSPIEKWAYGDIGRMANHMKDCEFFERNRNIQTQPWKYPILEGQL